MLKQISSEAYLCIAAVALHVVMRHGHSSAYPNKAEIEKLGLETQGKSGET
jgi:hypothetical protein